MMIRFYLSSCNQTAALQKVIDFSSVTSIDLESEELQQRFSALHVPSSSVDVQRELGTGAFGTVSMAILHRNGKHDIHVAMKTLQGDGSGWPILCSFLLICQYNCLLAEEMAAKFLIEAKLLVAVRHVNIVKAVGVNFDEESPHFILLELLKCDLKSYLEDSSNVIGLPRLRSGCSNADC